MSRVQMTSVALSARRRYLFSLSRRDSSACFFSVISRAIACTPVRLSIPIDKRTFRLDPDETTVLLSHFVPGKLSSAALFAGFHPRLRGKSATGPGRAANRSEGSASPPACSRPSLDKPRSHPRSFLRSHAHRCIRGSGRTVCCISPIVPAGPLQPARTRISDRQEQSSAPTLQAQPFDLERVIFRHKRSVPVRSFGLA